MRKYSAKEWAQHLTVLFFGVVIIALGVAIFLLTDFGMDPFTMLVNGVHKTIPAISNGLAHFLINLVLLVIIFFTARRYIFIGTVVAWAFTGLFVDIWSALLAPFISAELPMVVRVLLLVAGTVIMGAGVSLFTQPRMGAGPNDLVSIILSERLAFPIRWTRMGVDAFWLVTGMLLGSKLGLGTVVGLLLTGPSIQVFNAIFAKTPLAVKPATENP
ncbi:MAG TPA: YitT family protein [Firmicutes bacterium]|nr:YitT family protein [Bacillota bacterium]